MFDIAIIAGAVAAALTGIVLVVGLHVTPTSYDTKL